MEDVVNTETQQYDDADDVDTVLSRPIVTVLKRYVKILHIDHSNSTSHFIQDAGPK